jgi:hypothetical protein
MMRKAQSRAQRSKGGKPTHPIEPGAAEWRFRADFGREMDDRQVTVFGATRPVPLRDPQGPLRGHERPSSVRAEPEPAPVHLRHQSRPGVGSDRTRHHLGRPTILSRG